MSHPNTIPIGSSDHLSVTHKAAFVMHSELNYQQDAVIQTDLNFIITGWNPAAEYFHGKEGAMGRNLFQLVDIDFLEGSIEQLRNDLHTNGTWGGAVIFNRHDGQKIHFRSTATYIINETASPVAIMFLSHNISEIKNHEKQLIEAEKKYETLVNTLPDGVVMINADGKIEASNKKGAEILGLTEEELLGRVTASSGWNAIKEDGSEFSLEEFPAMVCLQNGQPQKNVTMGIKRKDGKIVWLMVNAQALFHPDEIKPYAAVVSYSDITEKINAGEELRKSNERFYYAGRISSDAIWDIDLETNEIYRSDAFNYFSGYTKEQIQPDLDWWFDRVHPDDKERVRNKVKESISKGIACWQDEYRFLCADGHFKYLLDRGMILYKNGKPIRIVGAIQDLTERKELEAWLLQEEIKKQKQLNQATIAAQERERNEISRELHDNVNQILMSAKLFIDTALKTPERTHELLYKAIEYQVLALEEIRKLSKTLSSSLIKTVGLKESLADIIHNMESLQQLDVSFKFNQLVEDKLSNDQKLMIFRIIQEQTINIIKHAGAKKVQLFINEINDIVHLVISDDGKGFDPAITGTKGIGFSNIKSRADANDGKVNVISSPGNGCTVELRFPLQPGSIKSPILTAPAGSQ